MLPGMSHSLGYWNDQLEYFVDASNIDHEVVKTIEEYVARNPPIYPELVQLLTRLGQIYIHFGLRPPEELRTFFKQHRQSLATCRLQNSSLFFIQWAHFEIQQNRIPKALSILQDALKDETQPSNLLDQAIQSIYENNSIPANLLTLNTFFKLASLEGTTSIEDVGKRLKEIFANVHAAKKEYNNTNGENGSIPESKDLLDDDFFDRIQQRLSSFQETLSNATRRLSNPMVQRAKLSSERLSNSIEAMLTESPVKLPSKHDIMISAIQHKVKRVSFSPSVLENDSSSTHRNIIPLPKIKRRLKPEQDTITSSTIAVKDDQELTNHSAPLHQSPPKQTNESPIVGVVEAERRVKVVEINGKRFQILQLIGKGGSSKVYKAIGTDFQIYALKRVRLKGLDKFTLEGYMNEIDLLQKLSHNPWIIKLLDTCMDPDKNNLHLLMEFGEIDLASMLAEKKSQYTLPTNDSSYLNFVRFYWEQILHSVHSVHQERIIHCDLKPANFLLVKGTLKLIDFGISKAIHSNETTNVVRENQVGTVNYMAPEALTGTNDSCNSQLKIGRPSDVWSLGCILYEMVYGAPPFGSFNVIQRIQKIIDSSYHITYPVLQNEHLRSCIQQCLEREPIKRPTIQQLLSHQFLTN